ncbi:MAG: hypothetical protein KBC57_02995 [Neisseriaceae bacterium]|nr:hypothetical protein [Neisseriaceae bacterium]MBP6861305.1 hypothetical protein [Neisseriaceae bacterium]
MALIIREDFKEVADLINRLITIGQEFSKYETRWIELANNEDWQIVNNIKDPMSKRHLEALYNTGSAVSTQMKNQLVSLNENITNYPSLSAIVEKLGQDQSWVAQIASLESLLSQANETYTGLNVHIKACQQMARLFKIQISQLNIIKYTLDLLEDSDTYSKELTIATTNAQVEKSLASSAALLQNNSDNKALLQQILAALSELKPHEAEASINHAFPPIDTDYGVTPPDEAATPRKTIRATQQNTQAPEATPYRLY